MAQRVLVEIIQAFIACVLIGIEAYLLVSGKPTNGFTEAVPIVLAFYFGRQVGNGINAMLSQSGSTSSSTDSGEENA
jgi:hypothetical protein